MMCAVGTQPNIKSFTLHGAGSRSQPTAPFDRIGRTGRAGKSGHAHTFFSAGSDKPRAGELINVLREAGQTVPEELLKFGTTVKKKEHKLYGAHFKDVDFNAKATKITFDD